MQETAKHGLPYIYIMRFSFQGKLSFYFRKINKKDYYILKKKIGSSPCNKDQA
jgi:hypothetical protein